MRHDANDDGEMNIADAVFALGYLFANGTQPNCLDSADTNDSGDIDLADATRVLIHSFTAGPQPPEPFPICGYDQRSDELGCASEQPCP